MQEAWLRLSRSDAGAVENLGGWLTTVVARICLDMLRTRNARHEEPVEGDLPEPVVAHDEPVDPEQEALVADSVGLDRPRKDHRDRHGRRSRSAPSARSRHAGGVTPQTLGRMVGKR
ncbi:MAG: hypothetical protein ACREFI_18620 [Stellaceae bacterium]